MSPYILETLTIILRLLQVNPQNVIYLRGEQEIAHNWLQYGLKSELRIRARHLSDARVPLQKDIDAFFNTLPIANFDSTSELLIIK